MLFNSYTFLFVFLPITLVGFWSLGRSRSWAKGWLVLMSLVFYSWWNPPFVLLILASILVNYAVGYQLGRWYLNTARTGARRGLLALGVVLNLSAILYYKYARFLQLTSNAWFGTHWPLLDVFLPLGISFFTFQQITYLVDANRGRVVNYNLIDYALFVTFFPQLIAGPIVHHADILPQFARSRLYRYKSSDIAVGFTLLAFGLFKKVVLADSVALYASPVFGAAAKGVALTVWEAWGGALAYTLQLYFDFSGYSDMAIGLSRLFGIRLPLNFNSPYQATSIIDFWKRWHITLSQFLRDYLYIPLGGNRAGVFRRYINIMVTMLLGGLWHGAGWTFVWWGGLHGLYLVVNHLWRAGIQRRDPSRRAVSAGWPGRVLTFLAVVVGWVFFRAESFSSASAILKAMVGLNGLALPALFQRWFGLQVGWLHFDGPFENELFGCGGILWVFALLWISWFTPNAVAILYRARPLSGSMRRTLPRVSGIWTWRMKPVWAVFASVLFLVAVGMMSRISEFLYFQF